MLLFRKYHLIKKNIKKLCFSRLIEKRYIMFFRQKRNNIDDKKEIEIKISFVSRRLFNYHMFTDHMFGIIDEKEFKKTFDYFNFDFVKYRYNYTKQGYDILECKNINFQ